MEKIKQNIKFKEKGGKLTEDMLSNTEDLYTSAQNFDEKGLQQFYTPLEFSRFLASCLPVKLSATSEKGSLVLDPMAGNGNLLIPFISNKLSECIGIEIDAGNIPEDMPDNLTFYNADFVKLAEYFKDVDLQFPVIAANPPFSLKWLRDKKEVESQEWTLQYIYDNLAFMGCAYMICLKSFADKVMTSSKFEEIRTKIIAKLNVKNLFVRSNAGIEASVLFIVGKRIYLEPVQESLDFLKFQEEKERMKNFASRIRFAYSDETFVSFDSKDISENTDLVQGCYAEYKRAKAGNIYDIDVRDGIIRLNLTNYKWYKIQNYHRDKYESIKTVHLKSPSYLAFNSKVKTDIYLLIDDNVLTINPEAKMAIDQVCRLGELVTTPFKALPPQQRLGYLTDHTKIKCVKSFGRTVRQDDELKELMYKENMKYDLMTSVSTIIRFDIAEKSNVTLKVFNILGQEVRTLINSVVSPGEKSVSWDGRNDNGATVTSGIYIYVINAGDFRESKKMIFLK
jgi:hypothetical protein